LSEADAGGDPACWAHLVCPNCGAVVKHRDADVCTRCGETLPED